ncbi:hypothetical protein SAMN05444920_103396 [Nonomuraea solani]|uniref:TIGR03086 family protein n=1 Tax=Nonomuraea solani TaxID=1144553 RepID=A0A1H6BH25_9ACTN|nr:hypothetical protein SAMN05444920_103396 [Nonomuraea solani]
MSEQGQALAAGVALLERAINYTLGSLRLVTPAALCRATPCAGWNLQQLLEHLDDSLHTLNEAATGHIHPPSPPPIPPRYATPKIHHTTDQAPVLGYGVDRGRAASQAAGQDCGSGVHKAASEEAVPGRDMDRGSADPGADPGAGPGHGMNRGSAACQPGSRGAVSDRGVDRGSVVGQHADLGDVSGRGVDRGSVVGQHADLGGVSGRGVDRRGVLRRTSGQGAVPYQRVPLDAGVGNPALLLRDGAAEVLGRWAAVLAGGPIAIGDRHLTSPMVAAVGAIEIAVHGWDVATACGERRPIPAPMAEELLDLALLLITPHDRPSRFGRPVAVPAYAPAQDHLLAYLGRRPDWFVCN